MTTTNGPKDLNEDADEQYGLTFIHPIRLLEYRLDAVIRAASDLSEVLDNTRRPSTGMQDRFQGWRISTHVAPEADEYEATGQALTLAVEAVPGVGRWLKWGMGDRAGTYETDVGRALDELSGCLHCIKSPRNTQNLARAWNTDATRLWDLIRELEHVAYDPGHDAESEWYELLEVCHARLTEALSGLEALQTAAQRKPPPVEFMSPLSHKTLMAACEFETLEESVRPQLRYSIEASQLPYSPIDRLPRMIVQTISYIARAAGLRMGPPGLEPEPGDFLAQIRARGGDLLRKLELTFEQRGDPGHPAVLRRLGIVNHEPQTPHWDQDRRELRLGDKLCKKYRTKAQNQETVLAAFQEERWPARIDDPLKPGKLSDTILQLNRTIREIKFEADGRDGVLWKQA